MDRRILKLLAVAWFVAPASAHAAWIGQLDQTSPAAVSYVAGVDTDVFSYSGKGTVTAAVTAVDLVGGNSSTSGCEASDFAGFAAGNIALLERGTCPFNIKASNALSAGAAGVLIFNYFNPPGPGLVNGTLTSLFTDNIPVMGLTWALGNTLANTQGLVVRMFVEVVPDVPEPGTLALLGLGLAGLSLSRRRKAA